MKTQKKFTFWASPAVCSAVVALAALTALLVTPTPAQAVTCSVNQPGRQRPGNAPRQNW